MWCPLGLLNTRVFLLGSCGITGISDIAGISGISGITGHLIKSQNILHHILGNIHSSCDIPEEAHLSLNEFSNSSEQVWLSLTIQSMFALRASWFNATLDCTRLLRTEKLRPQKLTRSSRWEGRASAPNRQELPENIVDMRRHDDNKASFFLWFEISNASCEHSNRGKTFV